MTTQIASSTTSKFELFISGEYVEFTQDDLKTLSQEQLTMLVTKLELRHKHCESESDHAQAFVAIHGHCHCCHGPVDCPICLIG